MPMIQYASLCLSFCLLFTLSSCSLLTIESVQEPLSKTDLNTRLRTQAFVNVASERIEIAADSLIDNAADNQVKINALKWKIFAASNFGKVGFQSSPRIALLDTWALMQEMDRFLAGPNGERILGEEIGLIKRVNERNVQQIESIASSMMEEEEFNRHKAFVYDFVSGTEFGENGFMHTPIEEAYTNFRATPDSLAVTTVGTLSEVVADLNSRLSYTTDKAGKQVRWNTELMIAESGIDTLSLYAISDSINARIDSLVVVAKHTPELLEDAIATFALDMEPLFAALQYQLAVSVDKLGEEVVLIDSMVARERVALDSIASRERKALVEEANVLADSFANDVMVQAKGMVSTLLFYVVITLAIILCIPFGLGYVTGRAVQGRRNRTE